MVCKLNVFENGKLEKTMQEEILIWIIKVDIAPAISITVFFAVFRETYTFCLVFALFVPLVTLFDCEISF